MHQSYISKKSGSWDRGENAISQSDCRILKSTFSPEQIDETASFACWYKFTKIESWSKFFWLRMVNNKCGQSDLKTLKLNLCQEWTDGINQSFASWYEFTHMKRWFKFFWVSLHSQKWVWLVWSRDSKTDYISEMNRWNMMKLMKLIFAWWYKSRKTKSWFNDFWVDMVKNSLLVHETQKSAVS